MFNLEKAGVDFIIIASNTPHVVFDIVREKAQVPLLSIVEPTYQAIQAKGIKWYLQILSLYINTFTTSFVLSQISSQIISSLPSFL